MNLKLKTKKRIKRRKSVRKVVSGTSLRPRLSVYRSNKHISAQIIDDEKMVTLAAVVDVKMKGTGVEKAAKVGETLAKLAIKAKVEEVVFDRNGYKYHGKVKALADAAREAGLKF